MKLLKLLAAVSVMMAVAVVLHAGVIILDFKAEPGFNKVTLTWRVRAEQGVEAYEVERSVQANAGFQRVGRVKAQGTPTPETVRTYTYVDKSVFKTTGRTYYYRLRIVETNGRWSFSEVVSVSPKISAARHTWGSIKAMFR